uniref:SSD domain-containing protein n=1 Tax=Rhabditophanes sp. KR3021 TaxID=114890 RepID=A0AC35U2A7_9BILA
MSEEEFVTCRQAVDDMTDPKFALATEEEDNEYFFNESPSSTETSTFTDNNTGQQVYTTNKSMLIKYLSLRNLFHKLGKVVAIHPNAFFIFSFILSLTSAGCYWIDLRDRIRDGYTPNNSPSRYETDVMREFWNASGDPIMTIATLTAKDGGSMLREDYVWEAQRILTFLRQDFTIKDAQDKAWSYSEMCFPFCQANIAVDSFSNALKESINALEAGLPPNSSTLTFPLMKYNGMDVHLERNFYKVVKKQPPGEDYFVNRTFKTKFTTIDGYDRVQALTNLKSVDVFCLIFRGEAQNSEQEVLLYRWEKEIFELTQKSDLSKTVVVDIIGTEVLDSEMMRDGKKITPYFAAGFVIMIIFVTLIVGLNSLYYDSVDFGKVIIAVGATLCPILAITSTYGIISFFGMRTNSFMLVMPFLVMGIGVDDAFLMLNSFQRMAHQGYSIGDRLGCVYEDVGPSITITSLTNFLSFLIGATTPTPEIKMFCGTTAIAMVIGYVLELTLFGPFLAYASKFEKQKLVTDLDSPGKHNNGWRKTIDTYIKKLLKNYCALIKNPIWALFLSIIMFFYLYFAITGAIKIETKLDAKKILPPDSPLQKTNKQLEDIIWADYHPVTIMVNKPFNLTSMEQMDIFDNLVKDFEAIPTCKGSYASLIWLNDYKKGWNQTSTYENFVSLISWVPVQNRTTDSPTKIDESYLETFLSDPMYAHWSTFVKLDKETRPYPTIHKFWFTVSYENVSTWDQRINLMEVWREVAANYPELNVTVWEANGMFVDQMLSLKGVAIQTGVLTLVVMAVVCTIFIPNPVSVITASLSIVSISIGVLGYLYWSGLDLDPVLLAAVLTSIGLSVDFTAHISYHFQVSSRKEVIFGKTIKIPVKGLDAKLEHTIFAVSFSMIEAGLSTVMCVLPLVFLKSYSPVVFVKTITLVVTLGFVHGLVVLPTVLCVLPGFLNNFNIYHHFLSSSSHRSCRYLGKPKTNGAVDYNETSEIKKKVIIVEHRAVG